MQFYMCLTIIDVVRRAYLHHVLLDMPAGNPTLYILYVRCA